MAGGRVRTKKPDASNGAPGVFISWSGEISRAIAEALSSLIPNIFQDVDTFVSSNDIDAGSDWFGRISQELAATEFGILCLTRDNLAKQWIHFEAGALAKRITDRTRVVPYLHGLSASDLSPPLSLFNGVKADKAGTLSLLKSLNAVRREPFEQSRLKEVYEKWVPEFETKLVNLPKASQPAAPHRSERELLEEVLATLRGLQRSAAESQKTTEGGPNKDHLLVQLLLKSADLASLALQEPDGYKAHEYRALVRALEMERSRLKYG